jgi:hypothetical protein
VGAPQPRSGEGEKRAIQPQPGDNAGSAGISSLRNDDPWGHAPLRVRSPLGEEVLPPACGVFGHARLQEKAG